MKHLQMLRASVLTCIMLFGFYILSAQLQVKLKYNISNVYAGIEVGAKGVKMSVLEISKDTKKPGTFVILKDTAVNTDFIMEMYIYIRPDYKNATKCSKLI